MAAAEVDPRALAKLEPGAGRETVAADGALIAWTARALAGGGVTAGAAAAGGTMPVTLNLTCNLQPAATATASCMSPR